MKTFHLLLLCGVFGVGLNLATAQHPSSALQPYTEFLATQDMPAKDYVLSLFNTYDLVILCERDHRDTTQYDLFLDILRDQRFIDNVGNLFTEIGVSNLNPKLNAFLHSGALSPDSVRRAISKFQRNCSYYPFWENANFSYLLAGLYGINQQLPPAGKINLYPSDMPLDWSEMDSAKYGKFMASIDSRDSIIASQIIGNFDRIRSSNERRKKALVIMNYRHAFGRKFQHPSGKKPRNVGRYLFDSYGDRVANVYLNFVALRFADSSGNEIDYVPIHDGIWDAAFRASGRTNAGFSLDGSPFGKDRFDIWPFQTPFTFNDVFTGFMYYLPPEQMRCVVGVPDVVDSAAAIEMVRRLGIYNAAMGTSSTPTIEVVLKDYNTRREYPINRIDSIKAGIEKWFQ